mmetsp:Transcript_13998/g.39757  ORF Transcript_13998/g.39757 Transcript_13998/m.39757 type:complete len:210 (+) Transcript_13998:415-1044(+)
MREATPGALLVAQAVHEVVAHFGLVELVLQLRRRGRGGACGVRGSILPLRRRRRRRLRRRRLRRGGACASDSSQRRRRQPLRKISTGATSDGGGELRGGLLALPALLLAVLLRSLLPLRGEDRRQDHQRLQRGVRLHLGLGLHAGLARAAELGLVVRVGAHRVLAPLSSHDRRAHLRLEEVRDGPELVLAVCERTLAAPVAQPDLIEGT